MPASLALRRIKIIILHIFYAILLVEGTMKHTRKKKLKGGMMKSVQTVGRALTHGAPRIISAAERAVLPKFGQLGLKAASTVAAPRLSAAFTPGRLPDDVQPLNYMKPIFESAPLSEVAEAATEAAAEIAEVAKQTSILANIKERAKTLVPPSSKAFSRYLKQQAELEQLANAGRKAAVNIERRTQELLTRGDSRIRRRMILNSIVSAAKTRKNIKNSRAILQNIAEPAGPSELFPTTKYNLGLTPAERVFRELRLEEPSGPSNIFPVEKNALGLTPRQRALQEERAALRALEEPAGPSNIFPVEKNALGLTPKERALQEKRAALRELEEPAGPKELFPNMAKPSLGLTPRERSLKTFMEQPPIMLKAELQKNNITNPITRALNSVTSPIGQLAPSRQIQMNRLMRQIEPVKTIDTLSRINNTSIVARSQPLVPEIMYPLTTTVKLPLSKQMSRPIIDVEGRVVERKPKEEEKKPIITRTAAAMIGPSNNERPNNNTNNNKSLKNIDEFDCKIVSYNVEHTKCKTGCTANIISYLTNSALIVDIFGIQNADKEIINALMKNYQVIIHGDLVLAYNTEKLKMDKQPLFGTLESGKPFMIVPFTKFTVIHVHGDKGDMAYISNSITELLDEIDEEAAAFYLWKLHTHHLVLMGDFGMRPNEIPQLIDNSAMSADLYYLKDENSGKEGFAFMGTLLNGFNTRPTCCYPLYKKNRNLYMNVDQILTTFNDMNVQLVGATDKDNMSSHVAVGAIIKVDLGARQSGIELDAADLREPITETETETVATVTPKTVAKTVTKTAIPRPTPIVSQPKIKLPDGVFRIDFIRHGLGCRALSNYIVDSKGLPPRLLTDAMRVKAEGPDPLLADTGLLQALALRRALLDKPYKIVYTSVLRRAIETALIVFGSKDVALSLIPEDLRTPGLIQGIRERTAGNPFIIVAPYLAEIRQRTLGIRTRTNIDNESIGPERLEEWLGPHKDEVLILPRAFVTEFNILGFLNELASLNNNDNESSYAVITHGNVMRSIYKGLGAEEPMEDKRPYPTEVWPMLVDIPGRKVLRYYSAPILPPNEYRLERKSVTRDRLRRHGSRCRWVKAITKGGGTRKRVQK